MQVPAFRATLLTAILNLDQSGLHTDILLMKHNASCLFAAIAVLLWSEPAFAYIDPMTGSMFLNALFIAIVGGLAVMRIYWFRVKSLFRGAAPGSDTITSAQVIEDLPRAQRSIVFFAEDAHAYAYFGAIIDRLTTAMGRDVCYLTCDPDDPVLNAENPRLLAFHIGDGLTRDVTLKGLDADVVVMTMPDLESHQIKRSLYPVHYVYIFHNMVSTHMTFTETAFDHYDTIFCVGPHHVTEIRESESLRGLPEKALFEHGYGRLDDILAADAEPRPQGAAPRILIAPSWGEQGLIETLGAPLAATLLTSGFEVQVRPHPITRRTSGKVLEDMSARFGHSPQFEISEDSMSFADLFNVDLMISDWSGAAMEFAFGTERPVVFIDVPRKVNNPNYTELRNTPLEVRYRDVVGAIVDPDSLDTLPGVINELLDSRDDRRAMIRQCRATSVFNIGQSSKAAAEKIIDIAGGS